MMRFERPSKPADFEDHVAGTREAVERQIRAGGSPDFTNKWSKYKANFVRAQHDKCGYCESFITSNQHGDVEHYRPKAEVSEFRSRGHEEPYTGRLSDRETPTVCSQGYWWLAYEWSNLLLACIHCNRTWKGTLFPIHESRSGALKKGDEKAETPLLLNPFGDEWPAEHLRFDTLGCVTHRTRMGEETIKTCGLDRIRLTRARRHRAKEAMALIQRLYTTGRPERFRQECMDDLIKMTRPGQLFAGMVRALLYQHIGLEM